MTKSSAPAAARKKEQEQIRRGSPERSAWRRDADALDATNKLGQRLRKFREAKGLSLTAASDATAIPAATLSRIENNKMSPTFSVLLKLTQGLGVSLQDLMGPPGMFSPEQQISFSQPDDRSRAHIQGYDYSALHTETVLSKRVAPLIFEVSTDRLEDVGGLSGHPGMEFCYVLSGTLVLHFADRPPQELGAGASALFNADIPHAYLAKGRNRVRVLNVVVHDPLTTLKHTPPFRHRSRVAKKSTAKQRS